MNKKEAKRNSLKIRKGRLIGWGAGIAVSLTLLIVANSLATTTFDSILRQALGEDPATILSNPAAEGLDLDYYKSDFSSASALKKHEAEVCQQIGEEGAVLLKNDASLPLAGGTSVSFFGETSVDPVYGGAGSGGSSSTDSISLKDAFTGAGFSVNSSLWDFYNTGAGSSYRRSHVTYYDGGEDWAVNEAPLSLLQSSNVLSGANGTTPIFVFGRSGGEGRDLARNMANWTNNSEDQSKHYLEPNSVELGVVKYLNDNFSNVILLINTDNVFELGWTASYPNIKSIIYMPGVGTTGFKGLASLCAGSSSFSGHLVDTIAYDAFSSPAMQNMGDYEWGSSTNGTGYFYVNYLEGIYVGYKYYETRYEDICLGSANAGNYDYEKTVQYPFGYGLSYTTFDLSDYALTVDGTKLTASVKVTNSGSKYSGKDVVQFYLNAPYTEYDKTNGIEKASLRLLGYGKTKALGPTESEVVSATFDVSDFKSYDAKTAKTYILDEGNYYVTAAHNAHQAINNILEKKKGDGVAVSTISLTGDAGNAALVDSYTQTAFDGISYATDAVTGTPITNRFDFASLSDSQYLTRSNWQNSFPAIYGEPSNSVSGYSERANASDGKGYTFRHAASEELLTKLKSTDSLNPIPDGDVAEAQVYGENNGLQLIDLRGASYSDERWNSLLRQMSKAEMGELIGRSGFRTTNADSIGKPIIEDHDGPQGLNDIVSKAIIGYSFTTETLMAQTWNLSLLEEVGKCIGEDGLAHSISGWYAPAMDIHRTPFAGRNFEYFSEDEFVSGTLGKAEMKGAASKGMYAFVKHFALNDQENHRGGVSTWANEQAIREIYLKAFEIALKGESLQEGHYVLNISGSYELVNVEVPVAKAVMSAMNRIGATWTGGCYPLITNVLKDEWGFRGLIETDYTQSTDYMGPEQAIRAGGSCVLSTICPVYTINAETYHYAKEAVKGILYATVNSSAMNGLVHGSAKIPGFAYYHYYLDGIDALLGILMAVGVLVIALELIRVEKKRSLVRKAKGDIHNEALVLKRMEIALPKPVTQDTFAAAYKELYLASSKGVIALLHLYDTKGELKKATLQTACESYLAKPEAYEKALQSFEALSHSEKRLIDIDAYDAMMMLKRLLKEAIPNAYLAEALKPAPAK
jgi:beta-glucosidase